MIWVLAGQEIILKMPQTVNDMVTNWSVGWEAEKTANVYFNQVAPVDNELR